MEIQFVLLLFLIIFFYAARSGLSSSSLQVAALLPGLMQHLREGVQRTDALFERLPGQVRGGLGECPASSSDLSLVVVQTHLLTDTASASFSTQLQICHGDEMWRQLQRRLVRPCLLEEVVVTEP